MWSERSRRRSPGKTVEETGETGWCVFTERKLFEYTEPDAVAPTGSHDLLDVDVPWFEVVEVLDVVFFGADGVIAMPACMSPFGMGVTEAAHPKRQDRFEVDA